MIDENFIVRYTNELYSTPDECKPAYDEFRDMFSLGQIKSKNWLLRELDLYSAEIYNCPAVIVGAWFGTLGVMLRQKYPDMQVNMLDIDPRCEKFIQNIIYDDNMSSCVTDDMYKYQYSEHLIINTSCEHIPDLAAWVSCLPPRKVVVLQSNNYLEGNGHVSCVSSEHELVEKSGLNTVWYRGKLEMPMYARFMVIGMT